MATLESLEEAILHLQDKIDRIGKRVVTIQNSIKHLTSSLGVMFLLLLVIGYMAIELRYRYG